VFKSYNKIDQNLYAVKKVPIKKLDDEKSNYYLNEVRHLSMLNHENIVRYYTTWIEFSNEPVVMPTLFIQMELCSLTLCEYLEERNYRGTMNVSDCETEAIDIFHQIVNGVKYIHSQGIIHRDLSTKNIFLNNRMVTKNSVNIDSENRQDSTDSDSFLDDGKNCQLYLLGQEKQDEYENIIEVKIGDFGLSRKHTGDGLKFADDSYGNLTYMAPEEMDDGQFSSKSDIYSLGIIFLELLVPFKTMMERSIIIQSLKDKEFEKFEFISKALFDLIKHMTDDDHKKRPNIRKVSELLLSIDY